MAFGRELPALLLLSITFLLHLPTGCQGQGVATINNTIWYSDQYGNQVYGNGTVAWGPVPVPGAYKTDNAYTTTMLLGQLFDFARSFVNTIMPADFPWDYIGQLVQGDYSQITTNYMELVTSFIGFAVCLALGLLFIFLLPLCGCCFCCCRMCGNCGGKLVAEKDENAGCKRIGLGMAVFLMALCMSVAGVCMWMTNEQLTVTLGKVESSVSNNLDDLSLYLDYTGDQFQYLAVNMYSIVNVAIQGDLNTTGDIIGTAILSAFSPYIDPTVKAVVDLDTLLQVLYPLLVQADSQIAVLTEAGNNMTSAMNTLGTDIQGTQLLGGGGGCLMMCQAFPSSGLTSASVDFSTLPNLTGTINNVGSVVQQNLTALVLTGLNQVNDVPDLVNNATQGMTGQISSLLDSFAVTLSTMVDSLVNTTTGAFNVSSIKAEITSAFDVYQQYDVYRWYGGLGLMSVFCLLVLLMFMALFSGCVGYKDVQPTKRSGISSCGGCCLVLVTFMLFATSSVLMLLTTVTFVIGSPLEKICQSLIDLSLFTELFDSGVIPGLDLGALLLNNPNITLSITNILLGCRANMAPFELMQFNALLDIDYYFNYTNFLPNIDQEFDNFANMSLPPISFIDNSTEQALINFRDSGADSINYTAFYQQLNTTTIPSSLSTMKLLLNQTRDNCTAPSLAFNNFANQHYPAWAYIEDVLAPKVDTAKADLMVTLQQLQNYTSGLASVCNNTLFAAKAAENFLQTGLTPAILNATLYFKDRILGYVDQYVTKARYLVYNEIGACLPLWNLYNSFTTILCLYVVDNLNGFWFGLGWGLFFYLPSIILCMKLSSHFRRMKGQKGFDKDDFGSDSASSDDESLGKKGRGNRVSPENPRPPPPPYSPPR